MDFNRLYTLYLLSLLIRDSHILCLIFSSPNGLLNIKHLNNHHASRIILCLYLSEFLRKNLHFGFTKFLG